MPGCIYRPLRHSSESWNPGERGRDIKWIPNYVCLHQSCHSRPGGNVLHKPLDSSFRWNDGGGDRCIRATFDTISFAISFQPAAGRNDRFFCALPLFLVLCCLFHFCSIVIPAKAGIQESGAGILNGFRIMFACTKVVIPAQAEMYYINHWIPAFAGMTEGSDRCIRAAFKVIPFAPSLQPVASRNDRFFCALSLFLVLCCLFHFCSIVIPAKAGIQEGGAGILNGFRIMFACTKVVIPAQAEMYYINHWIPAFAGRLRASSAVCSRHCSTTYVL